MVMEEESWDEAEAAAEAAILDRFDLFWPFLVLASESAVAAAAPDVDVFLRLLILMSCSSNLSWWYCITMVLLRSMSPR